MESPYMAVLITFKFRYATRMKLSLLATYFKDFLPSITF